MSEPGRTITVDDLIRRAVEEGASVALDLHGSPSLYLATIEDNVDRHNAAIKESAAEAYESVVAWMNRERVGCLVPAMPDGWRERLVALAAGMENAASPPTGVPVRQYVPPSWVDRWAEQIREIAGPPVPAEPSEQP